MKGSGTLTGTHEPAWPTVIGQTVADHMLVWECFGVTPPVFKEF